MFSIHLKKYRALFVFFSILLLITIAFAQITIAQGGDPAGGPGSGDPGSGDPGTAGSNRGGDGGYIDGSSRGYDNSSDPGDIVGWSCTGGGDNASCSPIYAPPAPVFVPVPTCSVSVSPTQVSPGGSATLSWNSTNADFTNIHAVLASFSDDIAAASYPPNVVDYNRPYGSVPVNPTYSRTYAVTFFSGSTGQQCVAAAAITVAQPASPPPPPPSASPPPAAAACPSGQHAVGAICVCDATNLPADSNGQCTSQVCPSGFSFDPGTGQCVAINQCALPRICSDNTHALNQCTGAVINCALNGTGWVCRNGDCVKLPPPIASISASPGLLSPGYTANIAWTSQNTDSCRVTGNNGDGPWIGTSGSRTSSPIQAQTIYTLTCEGIDGSTVLKTATANIIPRTEER